MCWNKRQMLRLVAPQPSNNHKFIINYFSHRIFHSFVRTILWKLAVIEKGPWNGRSKITVRFLFPTKYPKTNQIIEFMVKMAVSENISKAAVLSGPVKISGDFQVPEKIAFWYFSDNSSLVSEIGDIRNGDIFFCWNFYDKCRYHSVGELLIISVLSIHFNTLNLTNVYPKANTTVQKSSDVLRFFEKTHRITQNHTELQTRLNRKTYSHS